MKRSTLTAALLFTLAACGGGSSGGTTASSDGTPAAGDPTPGTPAASEPAAGGIPASAAAGASAAPNQNLLNRHVDYGEALRTASLKLVGALPPLADVQAMAQAQLQGLTTAQALYASKIDAMLADPRFTVRMIEWWRDAFKTGDQGPRGAGQPSFDTAATFAAMVVVDDRPYTDILTASSGTCPTYSSKVGFTAANCANGAPTAGVLTDPGIQAQYFGHMAFRRVRFIQETFVCSPMPAEYSQSPVPMGSSVYTSPWQFDSITGGQGAKIDFQDTSAVICANCHTTLNHIAPLFSYFDASGRYVSGHMQVQTPVVPPATSQLSDWLPAGQGFAWRNGVPVTDIPSLAQAIAADPDVLRCAVTRVWDWAFSRGDVVLDLATVPTSVSDPILTDFQASGLHLKKVIRDVFTSDDFVEF
jgi:hypothetical protein